MRPHDPQRSPRRWPLGVLVLALGLWGLHVAQLLGRDPPSPAASGTPMPEPAMQAVTPAHFQAAHPQQPVDTPPPIAIANPSPGEATEADEAEICGFGKVPLAADDPYSLRHVPPAVRRRTLDEVEAHMLASADPEVRAAALLFGVKASGSGSSRVEQLARLAVVSQDPVVYAIALEGCRGWTAGDAATCALLSLAQWVRLDADNAQPWLELAAQARQQNDVEAEAEAMRRAAQAHRSDAHAGLLPHLVDRALGPQAPPLQRTLAVSVSWSVQGSWGPSHTSQAQMYCTADIDADPGRRGTCEAIAATLSDHGTSVTDLGVGLAIGRALGWPAPRLQALQVEQDALNEAGGGPLAGVDFSCEAVDRMQAWSRQVGTRGERQAMRDVLARSGRSVEDWSAQYRRNFTLAAVTAQTASQSEHAGQ